MNILKNFFTELYIAIKDLFYWFLDLKFLFVALALVGICYFIFKYLINVSVSDSGRRKLLKSIVRAFFIIIGLLICLLILAHTILTFIKYVDIRRCIPFSYIECRSQGGQWSERVSPYGTPYNCSSRYICEISTQGGDTTCTLDGKREFCQTKTRDAGKECSDSSQCEAGCAVANQTSKVGHCAETKCTPNPCSIPCKIVNGVVDCSYPKMLDNI